MVGAVPESIWPVIMPGSTTMPMPSMELSVGTRAVSSAWHTKGKSTFSGVAPMFSSASTRARCPSRPFQNDLRPSETPVSALPMSMPLMGMRYCGSNTLCPTIQVTKNTMMPSPQLAMETDTITRKRGLSLLLRESTR